MTRSELNIIFYLPFENNNLEEADKLWVLNFQSILKISLERIIQQKIYIYNPLVDSNEFENYALETQNNAVFIQFIINEDYIHESLIQKQKNQFNHKVFQLNCCPLNDFIPANDEIISMNLYDEKNRAKINLSKGFEKIIDDSIWLKITDLSYDIKDFFSNTISPDKIKTTIYLAQANEDLQSERETILREFKHLGYHILPENNFPSDTSQYKLFVKQNLDKSDFSIHLIGNKYEPVLKELNISVTEIQNDLFNQHIQTSGEKTIQRFVWIPPNFRAESEKQRLYVENFKRNVDFLENTEIIQTPIEVFKSIVKRKIDNRKIQSQSKKLTNDTFAKKAKRVYFIHTNINESERLNIIKYLANNSLEVVELGTAEKKIHLIKSHQNYLKSADAILIYYPEENPYWLKSKLSDLKKAPGFGKKEPYMAKAIVTNEHNKPPLDPEMENILMIYQENKDISSWLKPFTEKIIKK